MPEGCVDVTRAGACSNVGAGLLRLGLLSLLELVLQRLVAALEQLGPPAPARGPGPLPAGDCGGVLEPIAGGGELAARLAQLQAQGADTLSLTHLGRARPRVFRVEGARQHEAGRDPEREQSDQPEAQQEGIARTLSDCPGHAALR
jgi:hypothetical protein